jgi:hypothetical protein
MAHVGAWPSIERFGLLSTTALLDLFEIGGERREQLESSKRSRSEEINHPTHGRALLRDQIPLNERKLAKALQDGLTPRDWYRLLNRKAYFWGPESRLKILREAREYNDHRQTIIVIDTGQLIARHGERISLCHMNSGATQPMAFPRGLSTFLSIDSYDGRPPPCSSGKPMRRVGSCASKCLAARGASPDSLSGSCWSIHRDSL